MLDGQDVRWCVATSLVAMLVGGCERPGAVGSTVTERDSAGVVIVESPVATDGANPRYLIDTVPMFEVGQDPADALTGDQGIQPSARGLSGGRTVISNPGTQDFRIYDRDGKRVGVFGGKGEGPGELQSIWHWDVIRGDTVMAFDMPPRFLLTVYDGQGKYLSSKPLVGPWLGRMPIGWFSDGRTLLLSMGEGSLEPKLARVMIPLAVGGSEPNDLREIGKFPGIENGSSTGPQWPAEFGHDGYFAPLDTFLIVGDNEQFGFDLYNRGGQLVRRVRRQFTKVPVTEQDIAALHERLLAPFSSAPQERDRILAERKNRLHPDFKPAYDLLLVSESDEIWVREYDQPYQRERPGKYSVFSGKGEWLCTVVMPAGFEPTWIGQDRVIGRWLDEDDVVRIRAYRVSSRS